MPKILRLNRHLIRTAATKLTQEEFDIILARSQEEGATLSQYMRKILLSHLGFMPGERELMEFVAVGEERHRLIILAAQSQKKLSDPEVQDAINFESVKLGMELAASRIRVLNQLRPKGEIL